MFSFVSLFIYSYRFLGTHLQVTAGPLTDFRAWWLKQWGLAQGCSVRLRWYGSLFMGSNPPKPNFLSLNSGFQAKLVKSKNMHIINCIDSIQIFAQW